MTPVFGEVRNGPALYANILVRALQNDPDVEFHILVPEGSVSRGQFAEHGDLAESRIHTFPTSAKSFAYYRSMQDRAIDLLGTPAFSNTILHGNIAHAMAPILRHSSVSILQINDYDAARGFVDFLRHAKMGGLRFAASLAWRHRQEALSIGRVDHLISNSRFLFHELNRLYRIPERVSQRTIHKGVDVLKFSEPQPRSPLIPQGAQRNLVFVGSNWIRKGLDLAIRVLARLPADYQDCHLLVAGETTIGKQEIMRLVDELGVGDRVHFLGSISRPDLPALLQHCDVSLLLSRMEAFGVAVLESLAAGLPVVACRRGGIPEILEGASHSYLVEPDVDEIVAAICKALSQDRTLAGLEGRRFAARFSTERMVNKVKSLYLEIARSSVAP